MSNQDPEKIKMGKLESQEEQRVRGTIVLGIDPDGGEAVHFKNLQIDDASESTVYLAADADLERSLCLGELKQSSGTFKMPVPFGTNTMPYNTVVIQDKSSEESIAVVYL
ncbi:hypothetical protein IQ249_12605 [Lusitaniella coriacea LEGE 07157]|uniref:DM13 domain-containing protein n=1 Tax=Lusitaniella coriacea LEGE 07157 TaxID=945747 RepID=A0A8J7DZS2_9CYAN|nr:hypothetical protein [Lusitaniella coriacea]MBE9116741.1 hypothetical protein [Lusitaniella coriacea LEGE 07157]